MKNLLLLTDFSRTADNAVEYGYQLAKELKANIVLCNIINIPAEVIQYEAPVWPIEVYDEAVSENENELQIVRQKLERQDPASDFRPSIICIEEVGRLTEKVVTIISQHHIDLIVVGAHIHKGLMEWALVNHVNELISIINTPIVVVPEESKFTTIRKIALAANYKNKELSSLSIVSTLAETLNAELFLFRVADDRKAKEESIAEHSLLEEIHRLTQKVKFTIRTAVNGPVEKQLKLLCKIEKINLLVMIHGYKSFIADIVRGSHSRKMAGITDIPLLVVPENTI